MQTWREVLKNTPQCPQRQDSTEDQLRDLVGIANKFGFYDAADAIKNLLALDNK